MNNNGDESDSGGDGASPPNEVDDPPPPCEDEDISICNHLQEQQQGRDDGNGKSRLSRLSSSYIDLYCRIDKVAEQCRLTCGNC